MFCGDVRGCSRWSRCGGGSHCGHRSRSPRRSRCRCRCRCLRGSVRRSRCRWLRWSLRWSVCRNRREDRRLRGGRRRRRGRRQLSRGCCGNQNWIGTRCLRGSWSWGCLLDRRHGSRRTRWRGRTGGLRRWRRSRTRRYRQTAGPIRLRCRRAHDACAAAAAAASADRGRQQTQRQNRRKPCRLLCHRVSPHSCRLPE